MQWQSLFHWWQIKQPFDSSHVRSFSRKPFSCIAFSAHQTMAQKMAKADCLDKMWRHDSSKLKSGCILSDFVTWDHLSNHSFEDTQSKSDLLAGVLCHMSAEGNHLQMDCIAKKRFARQLVQSVSEKSRKMER